jgi:hypothetical protein
LFASLQKNYSTFYPKNCSIALKNMGLGSRIRDPEKFFPRSGSAALLFRKDAGKGRMPCCFGERSSRYKQAPTVVSRVGTTSFYIFLLTSTHPLSLPCYMNREHDHVCSPHFSIVLLCVPIIIKVQSYPASGKSLT